MADLRRLQTLLTRGLAGTAGMWPELRTVYGWVHQAAHVLDNAAGHGSDAVRVEYEQVLATMAAGQDALATLGPAVAHFLKVTASYRPGLFHCYDVPDLPRTNNDLEQYFGSARYQERRATGRKQHMPELVIRGAVRVIASVATRLRRFSAAELRLQDRTRWAELRQQLEDRHEARRAQTRFRRDPTAYLAQLEAQLLQPGLPL